MKDPTPLKTILCPKRYPYAVACVENGKITYTVAYPSTLEDCYYQTMAWNQSISNYHFTHRYVMAEMKEIGEEIPNKSVNTYWCAI